MPASTGKCASNDTKFSQVPFISRSKCSTARLFAPPLFLMKDGCVLSPSPVEHQQNMYAYDMILQVACSSMDIDIISMKLDERNSFRLKPTQVGLVSQICTGVQVVEIDATSVLLLGFGLCRQWNGASTLRCAIPQLSEVSSFVSTFPFLFVCIALC